MIIDLYINQFFELNYYEIKYIYNVGIVSIKIN